LTYINHGPEPFSGAQGALATPCPQFKALLSAASSATPDGSDVQITADAAGWFILRSGRRAKVTVTAIFCPFFQTFALVCIGGGKLSLQ
jgi:hypothetical protein